ncbi:hypothetical protein [Sphingomonas aracearum]|nr:hypothetical protein [Sphingomonas aracearum]
MMTMTYNLTWLAAIPAGWRPILHDAVERLHALDPTIQITLAKEKFGSLRIHVDHGSADAYAVIDAARAASERSCELCGADAQLRRTPDGYYATRCPDHATGFMPLEEAPSVTFRVVVRGDRHDPSADHHEGNPDDGDAR